MLGFAVSPASTSSFPNNSGTRYWPLDIWPNAPISTSTQRLDTVQDGARLNEKRSLGTPCDWVRPSPQDPLDSSSLNGSDKIAEACGLPYSTSFDVSSQYVESSYFDFDDSDFSWTCHFGASGRGDHPDVTRKAPPMRGHAPVAPWDHPPLPQSPVGSLSPCFPYSKSVAPIVSLKKSLRNSLTALKISLDAAENGKSLGRVPDDSSKPGNYETGIDKDTTSSEFKSGTLEWPKSRAHTGNDSCCSTHLPASPSFASVSFMDEPALTDSTTLSDPVSRAGSIRQQEAFRAHFAGRDSASYVEASMLVSADDSPNHEYQDCKNLDA